MNEQRFVGLESRSRVSHEQYTALLEFMERNGDLARRQQGSEGRINADRLWVMLGDQLNAINGGVNKPLDKWKKVWADLKAKTKKKATQSPREVCGTEGGPSRGVTITAEDRRVLAIMGLNAVENSMIEEGEFDDPMPPPTEPVRAECTSQTSLGNLERSIPSTSSFQNIPSPPAQSATPPPLPSSSVRTPEPRRMRYATSMPRLRRGRMLSSPFERVTNSLVAFQRQCVQLEKEREKNIQQREQEREKNIHQREMERLRIESRRLDIEEQQVQYSKRLDRALNNLTEILIKLRPLLRP